MLIRGINWTIKRTNDMPQDQDGYCDYDKREIGIRKGLRGKMLRWVIAHEVLHAVLPDLSDDAVDAAAHAIAKGIK